jgi:hypothetical protein
MTQYDNNLSGIISRNTRKETEQHADIRGECEINGVHFWIDGWKRERKDGTGSFYSLKFKPKDAAPAKPQPKSQPMPADDDEIPW